MSIPELKDHQVDSAATSRAAAWSLAQGDFVYRHDDAPLFIAAHGATLEDDQGYKYLDAEAANGAAILGYDSSLFDEALNRVRDIPTIPSFCETEVRLRVAHRMASLLDEAAGCRGRVAFDLGGAQGIELALKIARCNNPHRSRFVTFEGAYHGRSPFTSQLSASQRYRSVNGEWCIPVTRLPYPDCEQCRFGENASDCTTTCISYVRQMVSNEFAGLVSQSGVSDVCAVIIEPMLNAGGMVFPDPRYMEFVVETFRAQGALIVMDEVFTGLYRMGTPFGFQRYSFVPDIVVVSKALTNGMVPLSCVWGRDPLLAPENFPPGTHSVTFANNPFSLAVAECVLDRLTAWDDLSASLSMLEASLRDALEAVVSSSPLARSATVMGGVGRILLTEPVASKIRQNALKVARQDSVDGYHGMLIASTGMAPNVIAVHPPLNISPSLISTMKKLLLRAFQQTEFS